MNKTSIEMSKLIVIGICGKARSGKDTVAQHLVAEHGFFRIGLADGIRSLVGDIDGPTWEIRKELEAHSKSISRWLPQTVGTECRMEIGAKNHWLDHATIKIVYLHRHHPFPRYFFVVPDIRYPREADYFRGAISAMDGHFRCIRITRPGAGLTGDAATHTSETEIGKIEADIDVLNDRNIDQLKEVFTAHVLGIF